MLCFHLFDESMLPPELTPSQDITQRRLSLVQSIRIDALYSTGTSLHLVLRRKAK
jgi:hypothetical protein